MPPTTHSNFSASSSARLLACPASYRLSLEADDGTRRSTVFSAEGTLAHSLSEACAFTGRDPHSFVGDTKTADGFSFTIDDEFADAVQVYVDVLSGLRAVGYVMALEQRVTPQVHWDGLEALDVELFGTADCIAYHHEHKALVVADLKFGKGVPVEVEGNTQLLYYASGAAHDSILKDICAKTGADYNGVENVTLVVVQPRAFHRDGPVRRVSYTMAEVVEWARGPLHHGVQRALEDDGTTLVDGKHCRFCPVLPHCDKPQETAFETARAAFLNTPIENIPAPDEPGAALPDVHLSDDKLGELLDKIEIISPWLDAVKRLALDRAQANRDVPGWKLVPKRALRRWADEPAEIMPELEKNLEAAGRTLDEITETRLLTPAQAQKALGKKDYEELVAPLVVKNSSGVTLAPDGDPRARVQRRSAKEAFGLEDQSDA